MWMLSLILLFGMQEIPAEPTIVITGVGNYDLEVEPSNPLPILSRFVVACRDKVFICSDNGAEFKPCARWELSDLGLKNARFEHGKCIADRNDRP